jgi:hypothetical protein
LFLYREVSPIIQLIIVLISTTLVIFVACISFNFFSDFVSGWKDPPASWSASSSGEHQKDQSQLVRQCHGRALRVVHCNMHDPVSHEREPLWHSYRYTAECSRGPDTSNTLRTLLCLGCRAHQQASEVGVPRHGELKQELLVVRRVHPEMLEETPPSRHLP